MFCGSKFKREKIVYPSFFFFTTPILAFKVFIANRLCSIFVIKIKFSRIKKYIYIAYTIKRNSVIMNEDENKIKITWDEFWEYADLQNETELVKTTSRQKEIGRVFCQ